MENSIAHREMEKIRAIMANEPLPVEEPAPETKAVDVQSDVTAEQIIKEKKVPSQQHVAA